MLDTISARRAGVWRIAERLGKYPHTIRRARMSGPNARSAPKGWGAVVADLAQKHADDLERRVVELRAPTALLRP